MQLTSTQFGEGGRVPARFTCDGADVSPPLTISGLPDGTVTLALILEDPDAPAGTWDHWLVHDYPAVTEIPEATAEGTLGVNSWGRSAYGGPCPPGGQHRYVFTVYAVDTELGLAAGADKATLRAALAGHTLADATLTGVYARP